MPRAGIEAFEFWAWWEKDLEELLAARDEHGLKIAACCTKFISLIDPATRPAYLTGLEESIAAARRLDCPTLISQVGDEVASPAVKVVLDIYHQQISEGHLIRNLTANIDKIAHFHAAGNPGRHELTIGEIHYPNVFEAIQETDYAGYVGLEYWPVHDPGVGLREVAGWF